MSENAGRATAGRRLRVLRATSLWASRPVGEAGGIEGAPAGAVGMQPGRCYGAAVAGRAGGPDLD